MSRCLALARMGQGRTGVNPLVGAVLVRDSRVIAEGYHSEFGKPHAELDLLEKFEQEIRSTDTLYVNLEPCCHTDKKTPPCAQMLIERGIKSVVYGMLDPNPKVSGEGITLLNKNNVQTFGPVLQQECKRLNRGFVSLMTNRRPWITLKSAASSDGRIAHEDGSPLRITSDEQDAWSHRFLRARHDAILVGVGTILSDNPRLTIRHMEHAPSLWRIVLDPSLRIPANAHVVDDADRSRTIVFYSQQALGTDTQEKISALTAKGVGVVPIATQGQSFDWSSFLKVLSTPTAEFYGIVSILVEGGPSTWESFRRAKFVDEEVLLTGVR